MAEDNRQTERGRWRVSAWRLSIQDLRGSGSMENTNAGSEYSRNATFEDLIELCRHLNEAGARYAVIGGFAVIH